MTFGRRGFLRATAATALVSARANVLAQGKVYRIGYASLKAGPGTDTEAFLQGMRDLGYVVGRNLVIEYRWADSDFVRFDAVVEELVRLNVDLIFTATGGAVRRAMRATSTIPIVMATASDPVGTGLIARLDHPGGNVTGMSVQSTDLAGKGLQLLRELVPGVTRVAVLGVLFAGNFPAGQNSSELLVAATQAAGRQMSIGVSAQMVADGNGFTHAFSEIKRERAQALIVQGHPLTLGHRATIVEMAARQRLPEIYNNRPFVDAGGLISYGPDGNDLYRRAATHVDKILKGARPGDLPVEQPTKFEMVINSKTAKALGLTIPQSLLLRADEVIQ